MVLIDVWPAGLAGAGAVEGGGEHVEGPVLHRLRVERDLGPPAVPCGGRAGTGERVYAGVCRGVCVVRAGK